MKKKWWSLIIIAILIILVFPIKAVYRDGGTVEYSAILYKVIKWNRIRIYEEPKTGTEVYFFPKNLHSLEYYDLPRPDAIAIYYGDDFVVANIGTYQWSKEVDGMTSHINACSISPTEMKYKETLNVIQGSSAKTQLLTYVTQIKTYKYDGDEAKIIANDLKYDQETQAINLEELDKGTYIIELLVENGNNEVRYSFKVKIVDILEYEEPEVDLNNLQTFYAEIKTINGMSLLVNGLDVNDINYRGEFSFKISEETKLEWRNTAIDFSDLDEGDRISITFEGEIQESYPAKITDVTKIQLLDNEK